MKKKQIRWPVGILDIGSNSIRMVIFDSPAAHKPSFNSKVNCSLGRNLDRTGRLYAEGKKKALHAVQGFHGLAQAVGVKTFIAFATAAMRDARDGGAFVAEMEKALKRKIHILSGEQEGRLAAQGVTSEIPGASGIVCDLGGGSLELAIVKRGKFVQAVTLPLGTLRLLNKQSRLRAHIDKHLGLIPVAYVGAGPLYVIGGAFRNMAELHARMNGKTGKGLQGYTLDRKNLLKFGSRLERTDTRKFSSLYGLQPGRAEVMHHVAVLTSQLVRRLQARHIVVSTDGVREGVLMDLKKHGSLNFSAPEKKKKQRRARRR